MSQFEFSLATPDDDAALRELLAATPMHGDIQLAFAREPNYFESSTVDDDFVQVVTAREKCGGQIVGMGSREISPCYVGGRVSNVGYLSALRIRPEFRGQSGLLARGYRFFHELHGDGRAPYYLTTIAEDNESAVRLLTSGRASLPIYHPLGKFHTLTFSGQRRGSARRTFQCSIRAATNEDGQQIAKFLQHQAAKRLFFPAYSESEFFSLTRRLKQLPADSILLAERNGHIVGTLGVWDQRSYKQTIICGYSCRIDRWRRLYNLVAKARGRPILPAVGEVINLRTAAVFAVERDEPEIAASLLAEARHALGRAGGDYLLAGLHERDPLLPVLRRSSGREYVTLLYLVYWPGEEPDLEQLTACAPYLELGCL